MIGCLLSVFEALDSIRRGRGGVWGTILTDSHELSGKHEVAGIISLLGKQKTMVKSHLYPLA